MTGGVFKAPFNLDIIEVERAENMEDSKLIEEFVTHIYSKKTHSEHTKKSYTYSLDVYSNFLSAEGSTVLSADKNVARKFNSIISDSDLSNTSVRHELAVLKSFYNYLIKNGYLKENPFKGIKGPKMSKTLPDILTYTEVVKLMDSIDISTDIGIRDRALCELMYATGMRVSETVNLKLSDINFSEKEILVTGKGTKDRMVLFNETAKEFLLLYIDKVRMKYAQDDIHLFWNHCKNKKASKPLTAAGVQFILERVMGNTSIRKHIYPHLLRHSFATHLLQNGASLRLVQDLLGHSDVTTTQVYTHVAIKDKAEAMKLHPRKEEGDT